MPPSLRVSMLATICALALVGSSLAGRAADAPLDTSALPRPGAVKEIYQSAASTIFTSNASVAATAEATIRALAALGWQQYEPPFTGKPDTTSSQTLSFKKGAQGLSAFVVIAPAQNNATSVQYGAVALQTDLPFPRDASATEYSPQRPYLKAQTADTLEKALAYFGEEMAARGWSVWSTKNATKISAGENIGEASGNAIFAHFIKDRTAPLRLTLVRNEAARTVVEIKAITPDELNPQIAREAALAERDRSAREMKAAQDAARARMAQSDKQFDNMTADILKQAQQAAAGALSGARVPPATRTPAVPASANEAPLRALSNNQMPLPLPETADGLNFKGEDGRLEFTSSSSVAAVADFYRTAMKPLGWKEQRSVINNANMVVLNFDKGRKKISFTVMQMGQNTKISGHGSGLETVATAEVDTTVGETNQPAALKNLEAEEKTGGLPVPKESTNSGSSQTPFRLEAEATVSADINSVLAFYRRELAARNWTEEAKGAQVNANGARLNFASPQGPAMLKLERKKSDTVILLAVRKQADAARSGLLPKVGQVKILIGNIMDEASEITINKKTIKVAAGVGAKGPDGPTLELPPGKYAFSIKNSGKPAKTDTVTVGADEIWGLMIGPGGGLALQMY